MDWKKEKEAKRKRKENHPSLLSLPLFLRTDNIKVSLAFCTHKEYCGCNKAAIPEIGIH